MLNWWYFSRNSAGQQGMAGCILSTEREKSTTKISVTGKDLIQSWWRNKKLFRQAKVQRIQYHQTSFTTNVKCIYIVKKYKRRKKILQNQHQTINKMAIGTYTSVQFSSVAQSCPTLCNPMNHSTPGLPVHHQLPESIQTHVHRVSDAI